MSSLQVLSVTYGTVTKKPSKALSWASNLPFSAQEEGLERPEF